MLNSMFSDSGFHWQGILISSLSGSKRFHAGETLYQPCGAWARIRVSMLVSCVVLSLMCF